MPKRAAIEINDESIGRQAVKRLKSEIGVTKQRLLIDLHDDYLKSIFKWLEISDLLTIMQVSERFEHPVASVFAKKYPTELVKITFTTIPDSRQESLVLNASRIIKPFLRYFGHSISKLCVEFDINNTNRSVAIEKFILEYCNGLRELELVNCRRGAFDDVTKPFKSLEVFRFVSGFLGENISQFDKWFPKLRSLSISHACIANKLCIEETLPFLEHLDIKIGSATKSFFRGNVDNAIRSNTQLRSICLNNGCKPRDLRLVSSELKELEKLEFWLHPDNFQKACKKPIKFKKVKQLILNIYDKEHLLCNVFDMNSEHEFLIFGDKLEELEVRCYQLQHKYINFARTYNLKKLTLNVQYDGPSIEFLMKIASYWPNLTEVSIQVDNINSDGAIRFITACNHLQRLNISDEFKNGTSIFRDLKSKLSNKWQLVNLITKNPFLYLEHSIIRKSNVV